MIKLFNSGRGGKLLFKAVSFTLVFAFLLLPSTSFAKPKNPGFLTSQPPMLTVGVSGGSALAIISVGDTLPNGYRYEAIPDGIGVTKGKDAVDVFVNHETSLVPFPYTITGTTATGQSDFDNSQVSRLKLNRDSAGVLSGSLAIASSSNYQRFCSSFIADEEMGFNHPIYFTNEEATDFVSPPPLLAWPPDTSNQRQAGLVVALDTKNNKTYEIPGLGRMNHENTVVVPGEWDDAVVALTGDDTFSAPASQLYMYLARSGKKFLKDEGDLWAFRVTGKNGSPVDPTDPFNGANDYGDIASGDELTGEFIQVPREIAIGDQTPLENWSNDNNVFQFIRVEDIAYDKKDPRIDYFADTGEPRAIVSATTGRLARGLGGTNGPYPNGRIFRIVLNESDPTIVDSLTILIDADAGGYNNVNALHNPDNVDTSAKGSLMITEDPGSHNTYAPGTGTNARLWRYDLDTSALTVVATVDQSADPAARAGAWEASGVVDVSRFFGRGAWLINVQAHTIFVEAETRVVVDTSRVPNVTATLLFKREGGQLLLIRIPGS